MAQVEWPTRHVHCSTENLSSGAYFTVNPSDRDSIIPGSEVILRTGNDINKFTINTNPDIAEPYDWSLNLADGSRTTVSGVFYIEMNVGVVTNYPTRPMLVDPAAQSLTSHTNPLAITGYTQGEPRYEGSVTLEVGHYEDIPLVEAFIDQLYDPEAWFELPLPGNHLTAQNVTAYNGANGDITMTLHADYGDRNLHGYFARVGARTVKVIYHRRQGVTNTHIIRIAPPLISGTTSQDQANSFSNVSTVRVRAINVNSVGNTDYGAIWSIDWVETNRSD